MTGIDFDQTVMLGWNFIQQNLSRSNFNSATLTGSQFGGADLNSVAMSSANLTNVDFTGADLTDAFLYSSTLKGANLTGAIVTGTNFAFTTKKGFTAKQLYTTASYAALNLEGISLQGDNLAGWKFVGQDLTGANFTKASTGLANFRDADLRGAVGWLGGASSNAIRPDGSIHGLHLAAHETLVIRNDPMPITVATAATFSKTSTLEYLLEPDWTSSMQFKAKIPRTLAGTLDLELAPGIDPASLNGETFRLFIWNTPLKPTIRFTTVITDPRLVWDLSNLYVDGSATVTATASTPVIDPGAVVGGSGGQGGTSVPEPGTFLMAGALGVWVLGRRGRHI